MSATKWILALVAAIAISPASAAPKDDYSWMRGANYVPSYARNDVSIWMDYDPAVVDKELGYAALMRLNTVRVFLQYAVYEKDPKQFLDKFESFLTLCDKHNIQMMPVLFDSCFGEFPDLANYKEKDWMANPGQNRLVKTEWPQLEKYVRDIVGTHRADKRIVMWDVMNEPFMTSFNSEADRRTITEFLTNFCACVKEQKPTHPTCAGFAFSGETREWADKVDVLAFHNYAAPDALRTDIRAMKEFAAKVGKPVIINEVVMRPQQTFAGAMPVLEEEKIGWCFWELMLGKTQFSRGDSPIQGIIYPDGTCRNPAEVASVMGIYPTTDPSRTGTEYSSGWTLWTGEGPRECRLRYADRTGEQANLKFYGTGVSLVYKVGPDCGIARILIDGKPAGLLKPNAGGQTLLDTYSAQIDWNRTTKIASGLAKGTHTLTVLITGTKNEASSAAYVQVVGLDVVTGD